MLKRFWSALCILTLLIPCALPVSAAEDTVMIDSESEWYFAVTDNEDFDAMDSDWMMPDYHAHWALGNAPFGDRINSSQAEQYGWQGDNYGLFLRQTFKLRSASVMKGMHFYLQIFYDNTIHIYLNGTEIFADDNGGSGDWVDEYVLIELDDVSSLLQKGENLLAVSVHDNAGGRELDLSFFATVEPIKEEVLPPPDDPDDLDTDEEPETDPDTTLAPEDFGSGLPFTNTPMQNSSPIVTVYVTAEPVKAPPTEKISYTEPMLMVGGALAIAALMIVAALLISRRRGKAEDKR